MFCAGWSNNHERTMSCILGSGAAHCPTYIVYRGPASIQGKLKQIKPTVSLTQLYISGHAVSVNVFLGIKPLKWRSPRAIVVCLTTTN